MEASSTKKMHNLCPVTFMCACAHEPMINQLPVFCAGSLPREESWHRSQSNSGNRVTACSLGMTKHPSSQWTSDRAIVLFPDLPGSGKGMMGAQR